MVSEPEVKEKVATAVRNADLTTVTAKQIRRQVEAQLGLEKDELGSGKWKGIVKSVIEETMAAIERGEPAPVEDVAGDSEEDIARILVNFDELIVSEESTAEEGCYSDNSAIVTSEAKTQVSTKTTFPRLG
jgi:hypothetical protein